MNKYFISFQQITPYGNSFGNTIMEFNYKINSEENLYKLESEIKDWKQIINGAIIILFFKELI